MTGQPPFGAVIDETLALLERAAAHFAPPIAPQELGRVEYVGRGIAQVSGLPGARSEEVLAFPGGTAGLALNIDADSVGVVLLGKYGHIRAGDEVMRTGRILDVPVGEDALGRVIDPLGRPLDGKGPVRGRERRPVERPAPGIMERMPVNVPLHTGIKVIDALIPVGRGQRELILGDRQTGKTALAVDTILNQSESGVLCVYCSIGQRSSSVARVIEELHVRGAMKYTTVVVVEGDDPPGLQFAAPYAATTMAEFFMEQGRDVLVVYDDLTQHARAYREISLLLRRPPGREAFPGDVFYIHSRLLERSTHLRPEGGGGSLTALPIIETEAQNISAYIPTNLISITDGQIYLSPELFQKGHLPPVDVGISVSRVGGKTQLPAYRAVAGDLRLTYSQFEELETFARFGTRLDEETRKTIERGRRVRAVLRQPQYSPLTPAEQVMVLYAVNKGVFDTIAEERLPRAMDAVKRAVADIPAIADRIHGGEKLSGGDLEALAAAAEDAVRPLRAKGDAGE